MQDVVQVFTDDQHSLVSRLEGLLGELGHVWLQEGVEDVGEGFSSLLLQVFLCCQTLLRLPLHHLSHLWSMVPLDRVRFLTMCDFHEE